MIKKDKNIYIKKYFVGLIDGDGSIQVNHWKKKSIQYRIILKLKQERENVEMLNLIKSTLGGTVRLDTKSDTVIWVVNKKEDVLRLLNIFEEYPLLTRRKICQLNFLKTVLLEKKSIKWYLANRDSKYSYTTPKTIPNLDNYFPEWLSGFIEAEGCFVKRKSGYNSFMIAQKEDLDIINLIKNYLGAKNKVRHTPKNMYVLEIYRKDILLFISRHFLIYPLLGFKKVYLKSWLLL